MPTNAENKGTEIIETVAVEPIILNIDDCEFIIPLPGLLPYKNTRKDSRHDGKFYRTYLYNGIGFTIIDEHKFGIDLDNDNLFEVRLMPTTDDSGKKGYDFLGHRTKAKVLSNHKFNTNMKAYTVEFVQNAKELDPEEFA